MIVKVVFVFALYGLASSLGHVSQTHAQNGLITRDTDCQALANQLNRENHFETIDQYFLMIAKCDQTKKQIEINDLKRATEQLEATRSPSQSASDTTGVRLTQTNEPDAVRSIMKDTYRFFLTNADFNACAKKQIGTNRYVSVCPIEKTVFDAGICEGYATEDTNPLAMRDYGRVSIECFYKKRPADSYTAETAWVERAMDRVTQTGLGTRNDYDAIEYDNADQRLEVRTRFRSIVFSANATTSGKYGDGF